MPTYSGTFKCIIYNDACIDTSQCISFIINNIYSVPNNNISIYPNPVNNQLNIALHNLINDENISIEIFNNLGEIIYKNNYLLNAIHQNIMVDVGKYAIANNMIKIISKENTYLFNFSKY